MIVYVLYIEYILCKKRALGQCFDRILNEATPANPTEQEFREIQNWRRIIDM